MKRKFVSIVVYLLILTLGTQDMLVGFAAVAPVNVASTQEASGIVPGAPKKVDVPLASVVTLYNRANAYVKRKQYHSAAPLVEDGLRIDPAYFPLWKLKALIALGTFQYKEAEETARMCLDKNPNDAEAREIAIETVLSNPTNTPAEQGDKLNKLFANMTDKNLANIMFAFLRKDDVYKFIPSLLSAWKHSNLGMPVAWSSLEAYAKGQTDRAVKVLEAAQGKDIPPVPFLGAIYYVIAKDKILTNEDAKAIALLEKAQRSGFPVEECVDLIGQVHAKNKRFKEAADIWETRWRDAENPEPWVVRIANARFEIKDYEKAAAILQQGLSVLPKSAAIQGKYLFALHMLGKSEEEENYALRLDGLNAQVGLAYGRALIFKSEGKTKQAEAEMKNAIMFAEASTGERFDGTTLESWLERMDKAAGASAEMQADALRLRDRGWNYWQEKEYRKAHNVWMEAIDLGFPQVRLFIINITMRFLEVGMTREAIQLLRKHVPNVQPFSFAYQFSRLNRWDMVQPLMKADSASKYSPWNVLFQTYAALVMGDPAGLTSGMRKLASLSPPAKKMTVTGLDDQGRFVTYTLTPAYYNTVIANFAKIAIRQKNPQLLLQMMNTPQWKGIAEKERMKLLVEAAQELVRQGDVDEFAKFAQSPEWKQLPEQVKMDFLSGAARELLRLRSLPEFLRFVALPQWQELSENTRKDILTAGGEEIMKTGDSQLFASFLDNPLWEQVPADMRSDLLVQAGKYFYRQELDDEALPYFTKASEIDAENGAAFIYLSLIAKKRGENLIAQSYYEKGLAGRASEADREYGQGMFAFLEGDGVKAAEHFLVYLKLVPEDHFARYETINILISQHRYMEARELKEGFEGMYQKNVAGIDTYVALTRQEFGDSRGAETIWQKLIAQNPDPNRYLYNLGKALNEQGKFELVLDRLAEPCRQTKDVRLARVITEAAFALELYEDALEWVDIGLQTDPEDIQLLRFGAESAEALAMYDVAQRYAERYLEIQPDSASLQGLYSRSLQQQQKWDELHSHDVELLRKNPLDEPVLKAESEYAKAKYSEFEDYKRKNKYLRYDRRIYHKILRNFRQDPTNWGNYAIAAASDAHFRSAIPAVRYLYDMGPNQTVAILRYPQVTSGLSASGVPVARVRQHIELMQEIGHTVISPGEIPLQVEPNRTNEAPKPIPVVLVFNRMDDKTLRELDAMLEEKNLTACLVVGEESMYLGTPIWSDKDSLARLAETGRWTFLVTDYGTKTVIKDESGTVGPYWGSPQWRDGKIETEEEMYVRWKDEMTRLKNKAEEVGIEIYGWVYPIGDYGQLTVDASVSAVAAKAYRRAVSEVFSYGFASSTNGFWVPHPDIWRMPMRSVYLGTDSMPLIRGLTRNQPTRRAILDFAKITSWHGQLPRADKLFRRAEELSLDLKDTYYFHARNAQYERDVPTAMDLTRKVTAIDPENPRVEKLSQDIAEIMRPELSVTPRYWWDSDGRSFYDLRAGYSKYTNEKTMMFGGLGFSRWERDGYSSLNGYTPYFGVRRHTKPGQWVEGSVGVTITNDGNISPVPNISALLHGRYSIGDKKNANGTYDLSYNFGPMETVEALYDSIQRHDIAFATSARVNDFWDLDARLYASYFTDENYSYGGSLRALYRFSEKPWLRAGYLFEAADSRFNPPQYYAPLGYMHHSAVLDFRYYFRPDLYFSFYGTYGMSRSQTSDWQNVWRTYADFNWRVREDWGFSLGYRHLELPAYTLDEVRGTLFKRF